jgi:hypothetical protein
VRRTLPRLAAALLLAFAWVAHAAAQAQVDLNLVLAVDVSGSVNAARYELQRQGYAAAFRDPLVVQAIAAGTHQAIAVAMVQWTGPTLHVVVVDWTLVRDRASADSLAATFAAMPRQLFGGGTSLSGAIDFAMQLLPRSPYRGERRVIDVSGDGANNRGRPAAMARDEAVQAGVVINGLPILGLEPDLDGYYRDNVIGGPGAFVIAAQGYDTFAEAIRDKLVNEIAGRGPAPSFDYARARAPLRMRSVVQPPSS